MRGSSQTDTSGVVTRFTLTRDADGRPLQFEGEVIAQAEATTSSANVLPAAIYRTKGGQHVAEFSRRDEHSNVSGKAEVFEDLDDALAWFRPGKLTTSLLKQLGRWDVEILGDEDSATGVYDVTTNVDFARLLESPVESLEVEYKSWVDISDSPGRAILAKAAIAMANHGGGAVVFGFAHDETKSDLVSAPLPEGIDRFSQDAVNAAVNRYAEPEIHCAVAFEKHPVTGVEHAIVSVPGSGRPTRSRRDCQGVISAGKYYVRKPGPRSEEPSGQDWDALIERCVVARRENMLDSIRMIVRGRGTVVAKPALGDLLREHSVVARDRWSRRILNLPENDPARFPQGHYELGFEIGDFKPIPGLHELLEAMRKSSEIKHTGWGPFVQLSRPELKPAVVGGAIEAWVGADVDRVLARDPAHCDFWRADAAGTLVLLRGYDEDGARGHTFTPGGVTDITIPVWRIGEAILYIGRLCDQFAKDLPLLVRCHFTGLANRHLVHIEGRRMILDDWRCVDDEVKLEREISSAQVRDNLVEVVHGLLRPLYEHFSFFRLSEKLVAEELERMIRNRF